MTIRHSITALACVFVTAAVSAQTVQSTMPMTGMRADTGRINTMGSTGQAQGQPGIYVEVPLQAQQNTATNTATRASAPDPSAYCYYADKSYSEGSRLRDQVCVRPGPSGGGYEASTQLAPLRWISALQYARGHY